MKKFFIFFSILTSVYNTLYSAQTCVSFTVNDALGSDNVLIDCNYPLSGAGCLTLNATPPPARETTSYSVGSVPFTPYIPFSGGTPLNANYDDLFAEIIDIPFTFCFFGSSYKKLVIGSNGLVTFDTTKLGKISYPNVEQTNPNALLPGNSIFGVLQDLVFSNADESEIYYSVIQAGSCRKFIINFYEGRIAGCQDRQSTQIVLTEFTNEIEIFVDSKPAPCATIKFPNALLGIMNADGSAGYSPPGRNTGIWEANQEGWKFSPTGNMVVPVIEWFDAGNKKLGAGNSITVCPQNNTYYTAKATYSICSAVFVLTDRIDVNFSPDFPLTKNYTKVFCTPDAGSQSVNLDDYRQFVTPQNPSNLVFTYHNTLPDAQSSANPVGPVIDLSAEQIFYVRVQNPSDPDCYRTAELKFQFISSVIIGNSVTLCDTNNDGVENSYQLSQFTPQLFSSNISGSVAYYLSLADAQNASNAVTTANLSDGIKLWVRFTTTECSQVIGPVTVSFTPGPAVNSPLDFTISICDINDNNSEPYDFPANFSHLISTDPDVSFSYYETYQEAYSGTGFQISTIKDGDYSVFVRVEQPDGCFSIAEIRLKVDFTEVEAISKTEYICFDGTEDVSVNLNTLSALMLISDPLGIAISFHDNAADAETGASPISPLQTIPDDGNSVIKNYYVRFAIADDCYTVRTLTVVLTHPFVAVSSFSICDFGNNNTETINLNSFTGAIAGSQSATATYFLNPADAATGSNAVSTYTLTGTAQIYVKMVVNECVEVYPLVFSLSPTPDVNPELSIVQNSICDNNNDASEPYDLTQHQPAIYSGTQPATFTYFTGYNPVGNVFSGQINNPTAFRTTSNTTVFVRVQFRNTGCFSVSILKLNLTFLPAPVLSEATLRQCDEQFNFNEVFDLNEATPQMFVASQNSIALADIKITYYKSESEAIAGLPANQISSSQTTLQSLVTVYARFESKITGCYSIKPIHLRTYFPPKAINSFISGICDSNLDGQYEVNLLQYLPQMVDIISPDNEFSFYLSEAAAESNGTAIADPANFRISRLPARIWVKVQNLPGCDDIAYIDLKAGSKITLLSRGPFALSVCDTGNDGKEILDFTAYEQQINTGATFEYYPTFNDLNNASNRINNPTAFAYDSAVHQPKVYVRVSNTAFCPDYVVIDINLKKTPMFTVPDHYFCPYNDDSVDITPDFSGLDIVTYEWKNPAGEVISTSNHLPDVKDVGIYTVHVTASNGCDFSTTVNVKHYEVPVITQLIANGSTYTVIATGSKTILYSIDGITWQTGNVFFNLPVGHTTFYVKFSGELCIGLPKKGIVLNIPNAFTPNDDGINDIWEVKDLDVFDGAKSAIQIFDRQQVLVHQQEAPDRLSWDGKWLGRPVPTDTYWYVLRLPDGRIFYGWIFLKNRN